MEIREAKKSEFQKIYEQGYREWPKGRTLDQYIRANQQEEAYGTRYVLLDDQKEIIASLMLLHFKPYLKGIGSIVVDPAYRKQGIGKKLIEKILKEHQDAAFLLYSEIEPAYYEQFGFQRLPKSFHHASGAICMIRANDELYEQVIREGIPSYF